MTIPTTRLPPLSADLAGYLARLGFAEAPDVGVDSLAALHRAHLTALPYDNLDIMLGRPASVDVADTLHRIATVGRAGYCFHHNGALGALLAALGFDVERRHGQVFTSPAELDPPTLNHLVLLVSGLPTPDHPVGRWWPDVGLGDAFWEPLPAADGEFDQGGFRYRISETVPDGSGWTFWHDPRRSFTGVRVSDRPEALDQAAIEASHVGLSGEGGRFARFLVAERRAAGEVVALHGCVLSRDDGTTTTARDLTSYDDWRAALAEEIGLAIDDVAPAELRALWRHTRAAHAAWDAAGRP